MLRNGPNASGREAFKLGLMELVGRGVLALDNPGKDAVLRDGPQPRAPRERALMAIWDVYRAAPSHTGDGRPGLRLKDLGRSASKQYGSIDKYVKAEVLPALVDRGLYEPREGRVLWIFPTTRYDLTQQGTEAQADLNRWLEVGRERFPAWSSDDPRRAMSYAGMAARRCR